ncbi:MAG: hypothetical protein PHQ72_08970 [Hespellia sp.]|nr:hypothetical protein [Hespellia sp.]
MNLQVAEIFGNGMVLQQNKPVYIWGTGDSGSTVIATVQNVTEKAVVGTEGTWKLTLPALHASECETLVIQSEEETITYSNVAVGEVWIAGGQSNMEFYMRYDKDFDDTVKKCENKNIRFFDYPVVRTEACKFRLN